LVTLLSAVITFTTALLVVEIVVIHLGINHCCTTISIAPSYSSKSLLLHLMVVLLGLAGLLIEFVLLVLVALLTACLAVSAAVLLLVSESVEYS
jgi:hypothetical protein